MRFLDRDRALHRGNMLGQSDRRRRRGKEEERKESMHLQSKERLRQACATDYGVPCILT